MAPAIDTLERYRRRARAAAVVAVSAGAAALVGWALGIDALKSVVPGQVTMKVNTALCLVGSGGALWLLGRRPSRGSVHVARALAAAVAVLAAAVLSQYLTGVDLGIDQALFTEASGAVGTVYPNRMAPNTAVAFVLLGAALVLLDTRVGGRWAICPVLASGASMLALLSLAGYLGGVTSLYGVEGVTQMAVPTSLALVSLGLGVLAVRPDRPPTRALTAATPGGAALRRLVPAVVVVPIALGALRLAGQEAGLYPTVVGVWLMVVCMIVLALALAWGLARTLDRADADRLRADALRESEERARRTLETAYDAYIAIDARGRIIAWNDAAERLFGYTAAEACGRDMATTIVPVRLRDAHRRAFARATDHAARGDAVPPRSMETTATHRDGREIPVDLMIAAAVDPAGVQFNAFVRDITERRRAHDELTAAREDALHRLALAAEYRDDDTGEHTRRVGDLSARLAERIGMPAERVELIQRAAPLHDVGKIGIPDSILLKPGRLTDEEFDQVKAHTSIGAQMLAGRGFPLLELAEQIALSHHERWDGRGYPCGLTGDEIPLVARIVALADVFDALTHDRPYKQAWTTDDALAEIAGQRGQQFDPELTDAFLEVVRSPAPSSRPGGVTA